MLCLKMLAPTRMVKNDLYCRLLQAESEGAAREDLRRIVGTAAAKRGIFEGDLENGELEIGQIASAIKQIKPAAQVMNEIIDGYHKALGRMAVK